MAQRTERHRGVADTLQRAWMSRRGLAAALWPLSLPLVAVGALRRALYAHGWLKSVRLPVPVLVVGNLVVGGAGKTPTVIALVGLLRAQGWTPGIVSRGYGRRSAEVRSVTPDTAAADAGDEPLLLCLRLGLPVVVGADRVAAARALLARHRQVDVIVSDDGLQHLRLARDAQVLVFDSRGAGNRWLLPAGPLREPFTATAPPRSVVLYNAPAPTTPWPGFIARAALAGVVPLADWWLGEAPSWAALQALAGRPLLAAAGTAQPQRFFAMLDAAGLAFEALALPDHHDFATLPWPDDTEDVVVTEKDAVKLGPGRGGATRIWVAPLDFRTDAAFDAALLALLPAPARGHPHGPETA